jgi:hypothetical protein
MAAVKGVLLSVAASAANAGSMGIPVSILLAPVVLFGQRDQAWWLLWDAIAAAIGTSSLFGLRSLMRKMGKEYK